MDQVLSATISSHLAAFPPAERVIFGLSNITAQPTKQLRYNKYQRLCYNVLPNSVRKTSRDPHHLIHALPLQAVTIDNDSEGSISKGGPSPSMEYKGVFTSRVPLQTLLYHGQLWYTNTRKQGVSATGKQVVEILKNGAQSFDKGELLEQLKSIKFASSALWCWVERRPYIKLPIAIFVPWFLIVNIIYGKSVASNLTPLWTIGPAVAGLSIKAFIKLSAQCRWWVAEIKLKQHVINLIEGVKTGELIPQCIEGSWSRYAQVKSLVSKKKLELAYFIQQGDAITALQQNSNKKRQAFLEDFWDKYEDARIVYLYLERKLKNII